MSRKVIKELNRHIGEKVLISGWVHRIRELKNIVFLILRDRTGLVQCVVDKNNPYIKELKIESVVSIEGIVKEGKNKFNDFEVEVLEIEVLSKALEEPPIEINKEELEVSLDTMLNNRVLSLRHSSQNSIFHIKNIIVKSFREFLCEEGFMEIFTPRIVKEGAEGGTEVFKVNYFGEEAYLAQSPQFYKQMMVIGGFERVFEIGTFFRAESHDTNRHLNEFISMDLEMAFINDEEDIMDMEERLIKYILYKLDVEGKEYVKGFNGGIPVIGETIPRIDINEVAKILKENFNKDLEGRDLDSEGERLIYKYVKEKFNSDFVFVTNYSRKKRPMYTMPKGEEGTRSFDLIFKGVEITSGGQRIHDYNMLVENFKYRGIDPESFSSYTESFKHGAPPHGGLAIGLDRFVALLLNLDNVRICTAFPRDKNRLIP
ncbi:aspartate--tRNA(Asn) ligase [Clostridium hydrogeniformans]|uniref:aspartate--tRNA(Asn) ligase n=1 Tax=Clostridium hydrogeniformans TaxID=349933 RepID=UPI00047FD66F|nr:aspartate--tRNA(Asn) ligase [Clostridium hydrogeniformans]